MKMSVVLKVEVVLRSKGAGGGFRPAVGVKGIEVPKDPAFLCPRDNLAELQVS